MYRLGSYKRSQNLLDISTQERALELPVNVLKVPSNNAKPFYLWATNCTNHKTISIALEQQSIFNIGDALDVDTRAFPLILNSYSIPDKIKEWRDRIGQVDAIYI